jgi:hypothetical protein
MGLAIGECSGPAIVWESEHAALRTNPQAAATAAKRDMVLS